MHMGATRERLMDLQRTVDTLQGRVKTCSGSCDMPNGRR